MQKYLIKAFDAHNVVVKQLPTDSLKDALALQDCFANLSGVKRAEIFERFFDENESIDYRPRVQIR